MSSTKQIQKETSAAAAAETAVEAEAEAEAEATITNTNLAVNSNNRKKESDGGNNKHDRIVTAKLLQAAFQGDGKKVKSIVNNYIRMHNRKETIKATTTTMTTGMTPLQVLTKFKDGQKRTALHFACQSLSSSSSSPTTSSSDNDKHRDENKNKVENNDGNENESNNKKSHIDDDIISVLFDDEWFPQSNDNLNENDDGKSKNELALLLKQKDKDGLTPIMLAAQHPDPKVAQHRVLLLLQKAKDASTASTTTTNNNNNKNNNKSTILKLGLARSKAGATPLHYAAGAGATSTTIQALYQVEKIAIHTHSIIAGSSGTTKTASGSGSGSGSSNGNGGTPLHWACAVQPPKDYSQTTIPALIELCGADINGNTDISTKDTKSKTSSSSSSSSPKSSQSLSTENNNSGNNHNVPSPLMLAIAAKNDNHAAKLLTYPNISISTNKTGTNTNMVNTLFHMAAESNLIQTLSGLIQKSTTGENNTSTVETTTTTNKNNNNTSSKVSLSSSLPWEQTNAKGQTPLDIAALKGHVDCVQLLLSARKANSITTTALSTNNDNESDKACITINDAKVYIDNFQKSYQQQQQTTRIDASKSTKSVSSKQNQSVNTATTATAKTKIPMMPNMDEIEIKAYQTAMELISSSLSPSSSSSPSSQPNQDNIDSSQDAINKSMKFKQEGNTYFARKDWEKACQLYTIAIDMNPTEVTFYSNRSACYISLHQPQKALIDAVMARTLLQHYNQQQQQQQQQQGNNTTTKNKTSFHSKACYRLATARFHMGRFQDAAMAAWEGLQHDKANIELKKLLQKCVVRGRQEYQQKQMQHEK